MNPAEAVDRIWDAVVVGAGPAGSVAARELARRGATVLLVDKATFPRSKVCGCCLNVAAVAALDAVGLGHVLDECRAVLLRSARLAAGRPAVTLRLPGGVSLSRDALDAALIREAGAAGVTVLTGTAAKLADDDAKGDTRTITLNGRHSVRSRIVILASGLATQESRPASGSRLGGGVMVPAADVPDFFAPGTVYMATGTGGYVGLVRVEDGRLDIGAAFDPAFVRVAGGLGAAAEAVLDTTDWPTITAIADLPWKGTPALTRRPATVAGHRLFAVGDAAGYVEPFTGEGMAWAISSAAALAPIAYRATQSWNAAHAREWERTHARLVGRRQGLCRVVARLLRSPLLTRLAVRTLAAVPALSRPVVAVLNRPAALNPGPSA